MTPELASTFARLALSHVEREDPNTPDHVLTSVDDVRDYWLLATLLRRFPRLAERVEIHAVFDRRLTAGNVAGELASLARPVAGGFERMYEWAWLLMLSAELARHGTADGKMWAQTLKPLATTFVQRFTAFLPGATAPIRVGTRFNSAFAIALALEYADVVNDKRFGRLLRGRAVAWFGHDADCQALEPGGGDVLSPALMEAECMRRCLDADAFASWLAAFLPRLGEQQPAPLFTPATVSDRIDGPIAQLHGVNLSRAWCWRSLANGWAADDPRTVIARHAASVHLNASLPHVAGDCAGEHWLATFALLALSV